MSQVAFLFPGQGSQMVGMGKSLYERLPAVRALFNRSAEILGYDLAGVCFDGPADRLNSTVVSQPAIFVCSLAALEALKESSPSAAEQCAACAGLSLGEYTALVFSGALEYADGLRLVQRRGEVMQAAADAHPGTMVSILGLETAVVEELIQRAQPDGRVWIANLLGPGNVVVSGEPAGCAAVAKLAAEAGAIKTIPLVVAGAFHTELMRPADQQLSSALAQVRFQTPRIPVWSNVDAQPHTDPADYPKLLVRQIVAPVRWEELIRGMLAAGFDRFYELGPGRVLAGLLKRIQRKAECVNVTA